MPTINKYLRFCLLAFLLFWLIISANAFASATSQYHIPRIKSYSVEDGLSQISVYDIAQDKNGYIWLATQAGIDRFDGYTFKHYGQNEDLSKGLSGSLAYSIEVHPVTGDIWVATINGLDVMRVVTQTFEHILLRDHQGEIDKSVQSIFIDAEQNIFVGSKRALYLKKADEDVFSPISMPNQSNVINEVIAFYKSRMLVATNNGVMSYDITTNVWRDELLPGVEVTAIELDNDGHLWIGTIGQGLFRADVRANSFSNIVNVSPQESIALTYVNDIRQMNDDSIWVSTIGGIFIFPEPNSLEFISYLGSGDEASDKFSDNVRTLFGIDSGLIFFGTDTRGFGVIDFNSIMFKKVQIGKNKISYFLAKQADDTLWVAAKTGVFKVNPDLSVVGPYRAQGATGTIYQKATLAFIEDTKTLWVGSRLGLSKISEGSDVVEDVAFQNLSIYSIKEGLNQDLWIGSIGHGVFIYDPVNNIVKKNYDIPQATNILPISPEEVWVSTVAGLYFINPSTDEIRIFINDPENENSLAHDVVTWISQRDQTSFYVGTQGHGLMLLELATLKGKAIFSSLFVDADLPSFSVGAVVEDNIGNIWMSSEKDIYRGNKETGVVDIFDANGGANETGYYIGAYAIKSDGTILFAGDEGVTYFHPDNIIKPQSMPQLLFTRVAILNSDDSQGIEDKYGTVTNEANAVTRITLSPEHVLVNIEFAALEFGSPESIEYAYRLIGFDSRWQYLDSKNRTVTYTNLDPGSYILEVKSTNRYGIWNDSPQRMPILVAPPWWQTTWAIILFGVVFLIVVFLTFRWRTYALHKRSAMLYQMVQEKTIELQLANDQLTLLTTLDPLTQVYNRRGFTDAVGKEFSKYKRNNELFSIILIDIDFFKRINDDYGHEAGDMVLIEFANLLQKSTRDYDILARWGGEEFIVLLPNTQLKDAINIANKYRETVRKNEFKFEDRTLRVSLTAGVANIESSTSIDECIKRADSLLYEGKSLGRDQVLPML
ncbi:MAG: diguanylate cyclase (GGDEF)-like protein [Glaciecola sp.]|jgi:diguanylate cyclase (GGDEF)-like protein